MVKRLTNLGLKTVKILNYTPGLQVVSDAVVSCGKHTKVVEAE